MAEIRLLRALGGFIPEFSARTLPSSEFFPGFLEEKRALVAKLWAWVAQVECYTETEWANGGSMGEVEHVLPSGLILRWRYQRGDLQWICTNPLRALYQQRRLPPHGSVGFLTNSGMSAVATLLSALDSALDHGQTGVFGDSLYLETKMFMERWCRKVLWRHAESGVTGLVQWMDSFGERREFSSRNTSCEIRVLDTTCYSRDDERIHEALVHALHDGVLAILVRSHTKLDMLGTEFGRLGSIVLVHGPTIRAGLLRKIQALVVACQDWIFRTGANPSPAAVPPFWAQPRFHALNEARNRNIQENHRRATAILVRTVGRGRWRLKRYHHDMFFTLVPRQPVDVSSAVILLAEQLRRLALPAAICPSFGFDFIAIDGITDRSGVRGIRVALPDFPSEQVHLAVSAIKKLIVS